MRGEKPKFQVGDRVAHAQYGVGTVERVEKDGGKRWYSVRYDSGTQMRARRRWLTPIEDVPAASRVERPEGV